MMMIDRKKKPFSPQELRVIGVKPSPRPAIPATDIFNTPISYRENALSLFTDQKPCFVVSGNDFTGVNSNFYSSKLSRAARDVGKVYDAFGVEWTFEPTAGGSISTAGRPRFTDVNDWKDAISMPDVNDWDWEADAKANPVDTRFAAEFTTINGFWFERLISLMDFVNAAMALVDEDQTDAINELFEATTGLAIDVVDKIFEYWPATDGIMLHDDWGSQKAPFFSNEVAAELFIPHMKKLVDHIHSKGRYCAIHSCGCIEERVHCFIEAGIDCWQLQDSANNIRRLYERFGDQIVLEVTVPPFDMNDEKAAVQAARDYVDTYCKPGKPTKMIARQAMTNPVFAAEVYEYSRKHFLKW